MVSPRLRRVRLRRMSNHEPPLILSLSKDERGHFLTLRDKSRSFMDLLAQAGGFIPQYRRKHPPSLNRLSAARGLPRALRPRAGWPYRTRLLAYQPAAASTTTAPAAAAAAGSV
jgi:hypothetical protein